MNIKRAFIVGATMCTTAGLIQAANAADVAPAPRYSAPVAVVAASPVYNWTGFYVGVNAGYGWGRATGELAITGNAFVTGAVTGESDMDGGIAGAQAGFNWQSGALVLGFEADGQWSGMKSSLTVGCGFGCTVTESAETLWFATARGRIGGAFNNVLVYATGGAAFAGFEYDASAAAGGLTITLLNLKDTRAGWTGGGGIEIGISHNVSVKGEYLYVAIDGFTDSLTIPFAFGGGRVIGTADFRAHIARGGINFRFGP